MSLTKINVSLDKGFEKENENLSGMSANARTTLQHILTISNGDLSETAKLLDKVLSETQMKIKDLTEEENLSDEEFYNRLSILRTEHKDTLDIIERLYMNSARLFRNVLSANASHENSREGDKGVADENDGGLNETSDHLINKQRERSQIKHFRSVEDVRKISSDTQDEKLQIGLNRMSEMKTPPKIQENSSKQVQQLELGGTDSDATDQDMESTERSTWRHHITIPKPFKMCEREEQRTQSGEMPSSMRHLLAEREAKERELAETCAKASQFRAKPVPAHVYLPLFDQIMEQQIKRRDAVRAYSKEILKATEKPFQFTLRERLRRERGELVDKTEVARRSASLTRQNVAGKADRSANDLCRDTLELPDHLYENRLERMHEDQLLREVKRQLRAQRLLQSSSLPPGMEERQRRAAKRAADRMDKDKRMGLIPDSDMGSDTSRRIHARPAPNFKQLHWQAEKSLRRLWQPPPEPTRPKPFTLHTSKRSQSGTLSRSRSANTGSVDSGSPVRNKSMMGTKPASKSPEIRRSLTEIPLPPKANASFLRENFIRQSMEKARLEAKKAQELDEVKRSKQSELSRTMRSTCFGDRILSPKQIVNAVTEGRKRELIQQDSARQAEYQRELEAMRRRVASRPLLITRQSQIVARQRAESKFANSLREAGLDPKSIIGTSNENNSGGGYHNAYSEHRYKEVYDPSNHFGELEDLKAY